MVNLNVLNPILNIFGFKVDLLGLFALIGLITTSVLLYIAFGRL